MTVAVGLASALGGCVSEAARRPAAALLDSAGVQIVTALGAPEEYRALGRLDDEPELMVGTLDGPAALGIVRSARGLPGGGVAVLDGRALTVRVFDAAGRPTASLGGRGDGPGELRRATSILHSTADSVWVWDNALHRVSVFGTSGGFGRSWQLPENGGLRPASLRRLRDGRLVSLSLWRGGRPPTVGRGLVVRLDSIVLTTLSREGHLLDTVSVEPYLESATEGLPDGGSRLALLPFGRRGYAIAAGDRVVAGYDARFELRWWTPAGGLERITRFPGHDRRLAHADVAAERARVEAATGRAPEVLRRFDAFPHPELRPAFDRLMADAHGDVWVREHRVWAVADRVRLWRVRGKTGAIDGYLSVPERLRIEEMGAGYLLAATEDATGVPQVVRYRWR